MPLPPPPAEALINTGKPIFLAICFASSTELTSPSEPGTTGTPFFFIRLLAADFSPIFFIISLLGPINLIPASSHFFANSAFSDKKPYPG